MCEQYICSIFEIYPRQQIFFGIRNAKKDIAI